MNNGLRTKIMIGGLLLLILVGLPTLVFYSQKKQEQRSHASAATTLYLAPSSTASSPLRKNVGETVSFDVMINPGNNLPSFVKLELLYDSTKYQPLQSSAFTTNKDAFPQTLDGPVNNSGDYLISLSVGSDPTKAINKITKVGTFTLTTKAATTPAVTEISFGDKSQVLSVSSNTQASENVVSTKTPSFLSIAAATIPTPTRAPTPTQTITRVPTPTIRPSQTPTLTPTPTSSPLGTKLSLTVLLHGIGSSGDNANLTASSLSNKNPLHPTVVNTVVSIFDSKNQPIATVSGQINYNSANGNYTGVIDLGKLLNNIGIYTVKLQTPSHLTRLVPGIQTLIPGKTNVIPVVDLIAGDVNGDNVINILDYNLIIGCYSDLKPAVSCTARNKLLTDLNDDGKVNQVDYNLFLREITVQNGE